MSLPRPNGFTLVELLLVLVIIGILAGLGIVRAEAPKSRAAVATMQSDLRSLAVAQQAYFVDSLSYADGIGDLDFQPSRGVTLTVGDVAPLAPATSEGVLACEGASGGGGPGCAP